MKQIARLVLGWAMILGGGLLAHLAQTSGGVRIEDVRYPGAGGAVLSALLYIPPGASPRSPAPAVMVSHGYINTREMQSPLAIELARRGFVVLAIDMAGHGYSGGAVGDHDNGGPDGLKYLQSLPYVDRSMIGLEGHSLGGVPVVGAALAQPDGYRSMVLEGSTTPEFGQLGAGTPAFPRNLAVVFGRYDEFAPLMWHVDKGSQIAGAPKLEALFGARGPVVAERLYGSIPAGTARLLANPPITHPIEHFSAAGVGAAVDWFQKTLRGEASPRSPGDQIWPWKEAGTLIALIGFVVLLLGAFEALIATRLFANLRGAFQSAPDRRGARWWLGFVLTAAIPAASFFPLMNLGFAFLPSALFPEWVANQILVWALANALVSLAISWLLTRGRGGERPLFAHRPAKAAALALVVVAFGYVSLLLVDGWFKADFRVWIVGLRLLDARHFRDFLAYLPGFAAAFLIMARSQSLTLAVKGEGQLAAYGWSMAAMSGGFVVLLAAQYLTLFSTGKLIWPAEALSTIIAIQFVPLLAFVGLIVAFTARRTGSYLPGGLICALVVTWYIVAGTATHWSPSWKFTPMAGLYPPRPAPAAAP